MTTDSWLETVEFTAAAQFLEFLVEKQHAGKDQHVGISPVLFRGQERAEWELVPRIFRPGFEWGGHYAGSSGIVWPKNAKKGTPQFAEDRLQELDFWIWQEVRVVSEFLGAADTLGLLPHVNFRLLDSVHKEWQTMAWWTQPRPPETLPQFPPANVIDYFALAQHSGVPTRLLDWTELPQVAAFFAAYMAWNYRSIYEQGLTQSDPMGRLYPQQAPSPPLEAKIAVFVTEPYSFRIGGMDRQEPVTEVFKTSRSTNEFIRAQRGVFVNMPFVNNFYRLNGEWPSLGVYLQEQHEKSDPRFRRRTMFKATLPVTECNALLETLWKYGVAPSTIFPTLTNAAKHSWYLRVLEWVRTRERPSAVE